MLILAFSYNWNEKSRDFGRGETRYLFPKRQNVLLPLLCDFLDQLDDALYIIVILRYNNMISTGFIKKNGSVSTKRSLKNMKTVI